MNIAGCQAGLGFPVHAAVYIKNMPASGGTIADPSAPTEALKAFVAV